MMNPIIFLFFCSKNYSIIKNIVEDSRCVGSDPNSKNIENYSTDYNKMKILGICISDRGYWLASRQKTSSSFYPYIYNIYYVVSDVIASADTIYKMKYDRI